MQNISFIIYEKSYLIRRGLQSLIQKIPNSSILAIPDNNEDFLDLINNNDIDIIIIGEEYIRNSNVTNGIKQLNKAQTILIEKSDSTSAKELKISSMISMNDAQSEILRKINLLIGNKTTENRKTNHLEEISSREADILKYIAMGFSNKEIADKLFLSAHTVVTHRKNITRKLGIKTVPGLTIYAILNKIIDINETEKI